MKRISSIVLLLAVALCLSGQNSGRVNQTLTISAGTPICVGTGAGTADNTVRWVSRLSIQMQHGGTGIGYVMDGIPQPRVPAATNSTDLTAELAPASSTAPGGSYSDAAQGAPLIDITQLWIDGSHSGDKVLVSYIRKF